MAFFRLTARVCAALRLVAGAGLAFSFVHAPAVRGQQAPTFRAATTLVTTDVIPRGANGRFVADLQAEDFSVLEDGAAQTISSLALVQGRRRFDLRQATAAPIEGLVIPRQTPAAAVETGRVIAVVVDDLHFEAEVTPHVRRLIQTLVTTLLHDDDLVAMASTGPSAIEISGTYDRRLVSSAVSRIRGSGLTAAEVFQMPETSQGAADIRRRAQSAFQTAYRLVRELEQVRDKRKVVIHISSGYDFDPFAAGRQSSDRIQGGRFSDPTRFLVEQDNPYGRLPAVTADIDLLAYMRELTLAANRANASLYTVDPRGLTTVVDAGQFIDQSEWRTFLQKTQSSLRYLAEQTGGSAVVNVNDFAAEFKRIDAETSDYYLISYYSTNPEATPRVRALDIGVRRPGVVVVSRSAYSVASPEPPDRAQGR